MVVTFLYALRRPHHNIDENAVQASGLCRTVDAGERSGGAHHTARVLGFSNWVTRDWSRTWFRPMDRCTSTRMSILHHVPPSVCFVRPKPAVHEPTPASQGPV